jgi:hypothetical protein
MNTSTLAEARNAPTLSYNTKRNSTVPARYYFARGTMPVIVLSLLQACTSIPTSHMLLPSHSTEEKLQGLSRETGAVVDALTVKGEEHFFLLTPSTDQALAGQLIDPMTGNVLPDQLITEPFGSLALVYYADPAKKNITPRQRMPHKPSYPTLAAPGVQEQGLSCDELGVELSRAQAVRWFARNEGAMGYTTQQRTQRHLTNAAKYTAVAAVETLALAAGGLFPIGMRADPHGGLVAQVGEEQLRWAVTAADVRIIGLLELRREKGCAERQTLVTGHSDLQNLAALDALHKGTLTSPLSDEAMQREQTRLLDELGPVPLLETSNRNCGVLNCGVVRSVDEARDQVMRAADAGSPVAGYRLLAWAEDHGTACDIPGSSRWREGTDFIIAANSLLWSSTGKSTNAPNEPTWTSLRYTDVDTVLPVRRKSLIPWIGLKRRNGTCVFFVVQAVGSRASSAVSSAVRDRIVQLKSAASAAATAAQNP